MSSSKPPPSPSPSQTPVPTPTPGPTTPSSPKFTLTQIRTLTDVGTITRLLHECTAYQRSLDEDLTTLLTNRVTLDTHLTTLLHHSTILTHLKSDSSHLLSSVLTTSSLADSASSKVRELDLAQSRVSLSLLRLDAVSQKSECIDNVRAAIDADNFEGAAQSVKKFFEIDDVFTDSSGSGSGQREEMNGFKKRLEGVVRKRLAVAVDQRDHAQVVRFIQLYPLLGIEEEGLQVYYCLRPSHSR